MDGLTPPACRTSDATVIMPRAVSKTSPSTAKVQLRGIQSFLLLFFLSFSQRLSSPSITLPSDFFLFLTSYPVGQLFSDLDELALWAFADQKWPEPRVSHRLLESTGTHQTRYRSCWRRLHRESHNRVNGSQRAPSQNRLSNRLRRILTLPRADPRPAGFNGSP